MYLYQVQNRIYMQMKLLSILLCLSIATSCSEETLEYIPAVVLARELGLTHADPPIDFAYHPVSDSLSMDTCTNLEVPTGIPFVCFATNKDVVADSVTWIYNHEPIDLESFLLQYGTAVRLYISGINKAGVLDGTSNHQQFQARIFCVDGNGTRTALVFSSRTLVFQGALTFDQFMSELTLHPNYKLLGFWNTAFTCDEVAQIFEFVLADCKSGEGVTLDLRFLSCLPDQSVIDECLARGFTVWLP